MRATPDPKPVGHASAHSADFALQARPVATPVEATTYQVDLTIST